MVRRDKNGGNQSASICWNSSQRIGIFIDVQNMFYSAKLLHSGKIDYGELMREVTGERQLVRAIAYIVQKSDVDQTGFLDALERFGYELRIKELKIRSDNTVKGNWDVGLAVDAMTLAPKLDTVVLVTGDGVFVPLVEALRAQGCRTEIFSFDDSTAGELIRTADQYVPIPEHVVFKEKKFEEAAFNNKYYGNDAYQKGIGQYFHGTEAHNSSLNENDDDELEEDDEDFDENEEVYESTPFSESDEDE